ncbi:hypothetical protein C2G38_2176830 [Gigaspora rosea]|uniref:Uncharacterized protein n=1 Tax=Gigaspora rosea TaxID=44941 RepID=A0A397VNC0_9GLOM|nr:hypothetical protein C2G38_2176830 [Gigaspora rosea]
MEPQTYSFLSRKSFDRISEKHVNQRKINRNLMDINRCDESLKNPSLQHDSKLKYWITNTFKMLRICMTEELHLLKRDENNLGTQPQTYSFLSRKSFDRISEKHVNQRKINRNLMDINRCDESLKNPSLQHDSKLKYWITNTFKMLRICMTEELHLLKRDENNLGTQV